MKKLLFAVALLLGSVFAGAQVRPPNYTPISTTGYDWTQPSRFSSGFGIPAYGDTVLAAKQWRIAGQMLVDTTDAGAPKGLYVWYDGYWHQVGAGAGMSNDSTLQQVMTRSSLITDPVATIQNDPSNLVGSFTIRSGVGGTYQGMNQVGYSGNLFQNADAAGNNIAGYFSSIPPVSIFGTTSKRNTTGLYSYLSGAKWQYMWIDSNRIKMEADTIDLTSPVYADRIYLGNPGTSPLSGGYSMMFSRTGGNRNDGRPTGVLFTSANVPGNKTAVALGSYYQHHIGFFTNNGDYFVSMDTNYALVVGYGYAGNTFGHQYGPENGIRLKGALWADSAIRVNPSKLGVSVSSSDLVMVKNASDHIVTSVSLASLTGGGSPETLQDVLTNGSTLTTDALIDGDGNEWRYDDLQSWTLDADSMFLNTIGQRIDTTVNKPLVWNSVTKSVSYAPWMYAGTGSGSGTPAGNDRDIQFNKNGTFGAAGSDSLRWYGGQLVAINGFRSHSASGNTSGLNLYESTGAVKVGNINWDGTAGNALTVQGSFGLILNGNDIDVYTASGQPIWLRPQGGAGVGIGPARVTAARLLHSQTSDAVTSAITYAARFDHITSGTAAVGSGTGIELATENASGTQRVTSTIESPLLNATNAAEDADIVFNTIKDGSLFEVVRFKAEGGIRGRWTPRTTSIASSATPTPNADTDDEYYVTALATNPTFAAPTGTAYMGQYLIIYIKDDGTPRTLNWNSVFAGGTIPLPTTTVANEGMYLTFKHNTSTVKWYIVGNADGY